LLILDCRVQQADLQKAKAQAQAATAALNSAKRLKTYGSISQAELTQALTQMAIANSEVNKLSAVVEKCTIVAPFKGAVSDVMVHAHETVKPGDPLFKIVSTEDVDFEIQVPSSWLRWLHIGTIFYVNVHEINRIVKVKIVKINPEIDSVSETVKIVGSLVVPDNKLLPGMSGQACFPGDPANKAVDCIKKLKTIGLSQRQEFSFSAFLRGITYRLG
ncbi:MAG: efflux RND transporter periplasmic adaptor subunit, partial [Gammaproteobacteria bacterium]